MKKIKNRFNSLSIKYKIFFYLIGFCAVMLFLLWTFQIVLMSRIYAKIRLGQMKNCSQRIEQIIKAGGDYEGIAQTAVENEACVMILRSNGVKVFSADVSRNCKLHKMHYMDILNIVAKARENGGEFRGVYTDNMPFKPDEIIENPQMSFKTDEIQSMIYCKDVVTDGEAQAYILLNIQLSPVDATVSTIRMQLTVITVIMIFFSAVLASIISRRVSRPIEKIAQDAQQLATGDYETVFNAEGYMEINRLSQTLTKTAEELGKVEGLRKDFIANVSHDLRTPLTLIGGYAEVMRDIPGENNSENAQMIIDETHRLSTLVNDLLDMSKIQSGAVPMEKKEYNLTRSVKKTVDRMRELLKREGYEFIFDYKEDVSVIADEVRISQCFYNILINAVNYTGEDKKVFARQEVYDDMVRISVTDTGEGVSEKDIPYVWERYYKSDKSHKRSITGTGLGLSIVRSVIKSHNGLYGVYNTKDKGACFWFSIPKK